MSRLTTASVASFITVLSVSACATEPGSRWDREPDGATFHAEVGDQQFDVTRDELEIFARPSPVPITLRTARVTRGDGALDMTMRASTLSGPATIDLARSAFVESFRVGETGLDQRWQFAAGTTGDLVVAIDVTGVTTAVRVRDGLLLHGDVDVFYGDATWVDATAVRTNIPARFIDGQIVFSVPGGPLAAEMIASPISATKAFP